MAARHAGRRPLRADAAAAPRPQFVVEPHMCEQCQRSNTNSEVWLACVQARPARRQRSAPQRPRQP
jgi:hypothetical protein